jgi:class 3 adenylate cyclase
MVALARGFGELRSRIETYRAKLYAEKWHDLVGFYLNAASAVVTEMGGKVSKELGDGLIALFGYQVSQENDADDKIICRRLMTGE